MKLSLAIIAAILVTGLAVLGFKLNSNNRNMAGSSSASVGSQLPSSSTVLDLSNKGLTTVTADIYNKTDTSQLILSNNNIKTLPSQIGRMTNVVVFKIDHNKLDGSLVGEIRQMSRLKELDVSYNNMTGVPAEIGQLSNLTTLNYSYNNLTGLPNELGNLKNNLRQLNLTGNPLSQTTLSKLKSELPNTNIIF